MALQPTFRLELAGPLEDVIARLRSALTHGDLGKHAATAGNCLDFRVAPEERRLWSPHLSVQLSETDRGVDLFGRFTPRQEVWTFVMMLYFAASFVAIGATIYGCVQLMLGGAPWALIGLPVSGATILALHLMSRIGQRLSADQMQALRARLDRVLKEAFPSA